MLHTPKCNLIQTLAINAVTVQGEITSRKQPGRGAKKASGSDIPIQAATAPDAAAAAEAEQGVPPHMSTQDYLEEAEELLAHPLDPADLQTQPEVTYPSAPSVPDQSI